MELVGYLVLAFFAWLTWSSVRTYWAAPIPTPRPRVLPLADTARPVTRPVSEPPLAHVALTPIELSALPPATRRQIEELPNRNLTQLQQLWLKTLRAIDRLPPIKAAAQIALRAAILSEWSARAAAASKDPKHFAWPSTTAAVGNGSLQTSDWHEIGMLSYLGYRVGASQGEPDGVRRQILDTCFSNDLPPINGLSYWEQWSGAGTSLRLKKLAYEIASFVRNAKRKRSAKLSVAITQWEADLNYLYQHYYVRRFRFGWPRTDVTGGATSARRRRRQ